MGYQQRQARKRLIDLLGWGLALAVVAGVILVLAWPGEEMIDCSDSEYILDDDCESGLQSTGSSALVALGFALAAVGNYLIMVTIVGFGVKLGNEATENTPDKG